MLLFFVGNHGSFRNLIVLAAAGFEYPFFSPFTPLEVCSAVIPNIALLGLGASASGFLGTHFFFHRTFLPPGKESVLGFFHITGAGLQKYLGGHHLMMEESSH